MHCEYNIININVLLFKFESYDAFHGKNTNHADLDRGDRGV